MGEMEELQEKGIENIDDLNNWIKYVRDIKFPEGQIWWRGQKNTSWKLQPGVFRYQWEDKGEAFECQTVQRFLLYASARHLAPLPLDKPTQIYPIMQHYGLPTRLLDWTESPLHACYFAVEDVVLAKYEKENEPNNDEEVSGALFAFSPRMLKEFYDFKQYGYDPIQLRSPRQVFYSMEDNAIRQFIEDIFHCFPNGIVDGVDEEIYSIQPTQHDLRMVLQMSGFTFHVDETPMNEITEDEVFCVKIEIPGKKSESGLDKKGFSPKKRLKEELKLYGVRRYNIYPDLVDLCRELREDTRFCL